jgi:hypothetical protein
VAGELEISLVETYHCPHCQAALEARTGRAAPWLRCPSCGRAGRVPVGFVPTLRAVETPREDLLIIDDPAASGLKSMTPVNAALSFKASARRDRPGSALRVVYAASLFVSVTLLLFMLLERSTYGVTACIGASIVSLGLLVRSARW